MAPQDDDIDDIMSTFGPVSIRTGQEDILFCPQDEEPLPMFDRIIGRAPETSASARQSGGRGTGRDVVRIGSGRGAEVAREYGNRSGGRSGAGGGGGFGGGGSRIPGGIRGNGAARAAAAGAAAEAAGAAAGAHKKPSAPPPAYSSLPRPREAPPAVPPPLGGGGGGGRPMAPARAPPARPGRRGEDSFGTSEDPGSRRIPPGPGGPMMQGRNRTTR